MHLKLHHIPSLIFTLFNIWITCFISFFEYLFQKPRKLDENEIVLITGAGQGIGKCIAAKFAQLQCKLVLCDINEKTVLETAAELKATYKIKCFGYKCDVSDKKSVHELGEKVRNEVGNVDILVNNAGIMTVKPILELTENDVRRALYINTAAHIWTIQEFLPQMKAANHGHITSIASMAGLFGVGYLSDYCASKFGAVGILDAVADELRLEGITGVGTTTICPEIVKTQLLDVCDPISNVHDHWLSPEEVADVVVEATLKNEYLVTIPRSLHTIRLLPLLLPRKAMKDLAAAFGIVMQPKKQKTN